MGDTIIKVENVGKQYRLGKVGTGSLGHDLKRWWHVARGKEDPFLKIGETNDRSVKSDSNIVWALKDISFDVKKGEVLGIIGKNGAGKSTLLKILSRVTSPSTGSYKVKGRIASLLEVGTGFHPDLSGRENIFLNGAIMGMTKKEIRSKFDQIVDFSGVERYIDTPVKRYSSGMYVRLAFAVAAHLEPEILIIDEVLAVGDAEFQKKCLGKMQDVSGKNGRTVLFVSHNLSAVRNLCTRGLVLTNGTMGFAGEIDDAINYYRTEGLKGSTLGSEKIIFEELSVPVQFRKAELIKENFSNSLQFEFVEKTGIKLMLEVREKMPDYVVGIMVEDEAKNLIYVSTTDEFTENLMEQREAGMYEINVWFHEKILKPGFYHISITARGRSDVFHKATNCLTFEVIDTKTYRGMKNLYRKTALVAPEVQWQILPVK